MSGDGTKTDKAARNRRKRSQRNKIVSVLTGAATAAVAAETALPGVLPPGVPTMASQVLTFLALCVNQFWPQ